MELLDIKPSSKDDKKYMATFLNKETNRKKTTHFGQAGATDYILSKDKDRRERYLTRHAARENWNDPTTAGALSKWILWGDSVSLKTNIRKFKEHFHL